MPDDKFTLRDLFLRAMAKSKFPQFYADFETTDALVQKVRRGYADWTEADKQFLKKLGVSRDVPQ